MSMGPLVSYRVGTWLIDECQIAFFMSCLMLRVCTHLFCRYFQCHLSYHQQFVWYPGYHGYQFFAPLVRGGSIGGKFALIILEQPLKKCKSKKTLVKNFFVWGRI